MAILIPTILRYFKPSRLVFRTVATKTPNHSTPTPVENLREIQSSNVDVNGVSIHYKITGYGKHTVLLLPGALGSTEKDFGHQLANMSKDTFTLVAIDPRGYGKSRPPERDWPLNFLHRDADDAIKLMENLDVSRYSVVGGGDGGSSAMILAAKVPERVRKLVTWGANAYVTKKDLALFERFRDKDSWSEKMRSALYNTYNEEFLQLHWSSWVDAYVRFVEEKDGDICQSELSQIECPTLILHGSKDPLCLPEHPEYLEKNIQNSKVLHFPEGKHNVHMKYFKQFNCLVEEFLVAPE